MNYIEIAYEVRVYEDGSKEWWLDGSRHIVEFANGNKQWWLNGKERPEDKYWREIQRRKNKNNCSLGGKTLEIDGKRYELKEI